ncbi:MAG: EVE domain-containing protein [Ignavibacteriae bacterium]|nr:EVE domain-containing protein [Ignavibacteriota bacterium]
MGKNYWLIKSEPSEFSIDDLEKSKNKTTYWDGVRNYQARNFLRDEMKIGDLVLYYHSNAEPNEIVGVCEIVKEGYPDFTAFDPSDKHFDPKSKKENPTWIMVDIKLLKKFKKNITLSEIKENPKLSKMRLVQRGNRLSVMPVAKIEFDEIIKMSGISL